MPSNEVIQVAASAPQEARPTDYFKVRSDKLIEHCLVNAVIAQENRKVRRVDPVALERVRSASKTRPPHVFRRFIAESTPNA